VRRLVHEGDGEHEVEISVVSVNVLEARRNELNLSAELFHGRTLSKLDALGTSIHDTSGNSSYSFTLYVGITERNNVLVGLGLSKERGQTVLEGVELPLERSIRVMNLISGAGRDDSDFGQKRDYTRKKLLGAKLNPASLSVGNDVHLAVLEGKSDDANNRLLQKLEVGVDFLIGRHVSVKSVAAGVQKRASKKSIVPIENDNGALVGIRGSAHFVFLLILESRQGRLHGQVKNVRVLLLLLLLLHFNVKFHIGDFGLEGLLSKTDDGFFGFSGNGHCIRVERVNKVAK